MSSLIHTSSAPVSAPLRKLFHALKVAAVFHSGFIGYRKSLLYLYYTYRYPQYDITHTDVLGLVIAAQIKREPVGQQY